MSQKMYESNIEPYSKIIEQIKTLKHGSNINPHKFILLLSLIRIFESNPVHENKFYFAEVEPVFLECFNQYYSDYADYRKMLEYPFYHLKNDGFWNLHLINGKKDMFQKYEKLRLTKSRLIETVEYAYLSEDLYQLFLNSEQLQLLKKAIKSILPGQYEINQQPELMVQEGSLFEHEQVAMEIIKNAISRMRLGQVLNNILIYDRQTNNYYEYDIILIGCSKLYVIELKHWSGKIQIAPYNWVIRETQHRSDPHKINSFKCKILKGIYQHQFRTYPSIWVESIVVLTNSDAEVEGAAHPARAAKEGKNNLTFSSIGDFLTYIKKCEETESKILNDTQVRNIADYLQSLNQPKQGGKYSIPGYETVEYLNQSPERVELLARPIGPVARGLSRFRVFRVPEKLTAMEQKVFIKKAYNTIDAVSQLKDHPNIHKVWLVPNDEGYIIEGSDWSETGTIRDYINRNKGSLSIDEINAICFGITKGLWVAHQNSIIHRAVKPENILLSNGVPKLMNFDLAYQMDENHITVITDIESLNDDGYIAPEILLGQDIDESTDLFSLGVIAYELFTGFKPFAKVRKFIADGGGLSEIALDKLGQKQIPNSTIEVIDSLVQVDRNRRSKDITQILDAFSTDRGHGESAKASTSNAYLEPGDTYDMYEIIELIGEGKEAQIYKARNGRMEIVALKLFNREIGRERIFREGDNTAAVKSAYVVECNNTIGHWKDDRYFLILDYIDGESMRSWIEQKMVPDDETFRNIAICLLQGLQACHNHVDETGQRKTILHSDIKPDNIIITRDKKAVLIDFGISGPPRVDVFQGTMAYIPPDSLSGADMQFSEEGDLFALGITLWEWLCGQTPYNQIKSEGKPCFSQECLMRIPRNLQEYLMKAIALEREERFLKIEEMIQAFTGTTETEEQQIKKQKETIIHKVPDINEITVLDTSNQNPFVPYLNSLSNASAGNENATAEAQIGNKYFTNIRVEHPIFQFIYRQLFTEKKHVILTGNAGDGKTTIAAEIYRHHFGMYKPLSAREESSDLVLIKDLSELPEGQRSSIFSEAMDEQQKVYLIVSNTGTLIENMSQLQQGEGIKKSSLLIALEADHPLLIGEERFLIVNIGRINSIAAALSVGERMLDNENWKNCVSCNRSKDCPICINVNLLQENRKLVLERIGLAYRRLYEYGNRLTMRQMTGHIAYVITAGLNCEDIKAMSKNALEERYTRYLFFNRFFGDDGEEEIPEAMQLLPVRKIKEAELGVFLDPFIERSIWKKQTEEIPFSESIMKVLEHVRSSSENSSNKMRIQVRRLLYFFFPPNEQGVSQYLCGFLQSPMLLTYLQQLEENKPLSRYKEERQLRFLLQVLQECYVGVRLLENEYRARDLYITLNPPGSSKTQLILGKAHIEDFSLGKKNIYETEEIKHRLLTMRYQVDKAELELDLPFLDYVARRYQGEVAEELSVFYLDRLQRFKIILLENINNNTGEEHMELLSIAGSRNFEIISIKIDHDSLEVIM